MNKKKYIAFKKKKDRETMPKEVTICHALNSLVSDKIFKKVQNDVLY